MNLFSPVFLFSLSLIPGLCFADWNVRGMDNVSTVTNPTIDKEAAITINVTGTRSRNYNYQCSPGLQQGDPLKNAKRYLVWFVENIKVNNRIVTFQAPRYLYDNIATNGYFVVEKSQWIDNGETLVIVGRDPDGASEKCGAGAVYPFSSTFTGKPVGITLPAGTHTLTFKLRVMRIQDSGGIEHVYQLALANRNRSTPTALSAPISISSYCTNNDVSSVTFDHGSFAAGTGNGKEASATVRYECNLEASKPKITFTGADVISGNQVKICNGLTSVLSATTEKEQGYNFRTIFKSTLSGNASSSCAGKFSKNVVAVISPP